MTDVVRLLAGDIPPTCPGCKYNLNHISFQRAALGIDIYRALCPACGEELKETKIEEE